MAAGDVRPAEGHVAVFPPEPIAGVLGVVVRESRVQEFTELERENARRIWRVRGIISDHVPLAGDAGAVLARRPEHLFYLNENPLVIYLHSGGRSVVYYELVAEPDGRLQHIEVRLETALPGKAIVMAWRPLNALLDAMVRNQEMPWTLQRLELLSPRDGGVLAYELVLPYKDGIRLGPLGGMIQCVPFAPYDAILREAIISTSPFYRLLCAFRIYEGTTHIRQWLREQCEQLRIAERLPGDPEVNERDLLGLGFDRAFTARVRQAHDLFESLRDYRNAIAHFLIEGDQGEAHVYLADGEMIRSYSIAAAALLRYAHATIEVLRRYYTTYLQGHFMAAGGMVLPGIEERDQHIVRDPE